MFFLISPPNFSFQAPPLVGALPPRRSPCYPLRVRRARVSLDCFYLLYPLDFSLLASDFVMCTPSILTSLTLFKCRTSCMIGLTSIT
jgi:hypothetical protein